MDFQATLGRILDAFQKQDVRCALAGGFAMGALGVPRATVDLDFLVHRDDLDKIESIMRAAGYQCLFKSENVSQYVASLKVLGEVDFIHAFRKVSLGMLARAVSKDLFDGKLKVKVLEPEDVVGLKVQAMVNDPTRQTQELADIESLMGYFGGRLDWRRMEEYFSLFGQQSKFLELRARHSHVDR
ncbi:MAG: nucleotidyltransferase family protein [Planctomycetota bacterium]|nr:nucleotidyltransferase family protein [Planctomycetota bacterium]